MVLRQSGTSIPSFSFSSGMAVISDVEREWVNLEQSEYQSFLKAQHMLGGQQEQGKWAPKSVLQHWVGE